MEKTIDRTQAPALQSISRLDIHNFKTARLDNDIPLYYVDGVEEDIVQVELRFRAGKWYEFKKAQARAACSLMKKGTSEHTSREISEAVEFYGAQISTRHGADFTSVVLFTLGKYLRELLPLLHEILSDAVYPQEEIDHFTQRQKQKLRVNAQNTDFHADKNFHAALFGKDHPYGYIPEERDYDLLSPSSLMDFQRTHYPVSESTLFLAGNITDDVIHDINAEFGTASPAGKNVTIPLHIIQQGLPGKHFTEKKDSVQSSLRIGALSIPRTHADYPDLNVLNTLFGGYFGSRLMANIREDKGYTYGIYSGITHFEHGSYFSVETEVGNGVCHAAIAEIGNEMRRMREEPVGSEELSIVRNYMMGSLLRATDGPFNRISIIKNLVMSKLGIAYFNKLAESIRTITPARLQELANNYLHPENMIEVICGNPEK